MIQWANFYETNTCQPFVKNGYTKFYENPTYGLVTAERQTCLHIRYSPFFFTSCRMLKESDSKSVLLCMLRYTAVKCKYNNRMRKLTSCWCARVCFISTILMLCSMAYFLARVTASCCSWLSLGSPAPSRPGIVVFLAPGPEYTIITLKVPASKVILVRNGISNWNTETENKYCSFTKLAFKCNHN